MSEVSLRRGGRPVLHDVTFDAGPGLVALVGPNGAGKSSLLRVLAGVARPHRGHVAITGHDLVTHAVAARRAIGYMPQGAELFAYLTAAELLQTFAAIRGVADDGRAAFVALASHSALDVPIGTLSAGQRRKLALVSALQGDPPVWLLDEPDEALDTDARAHLRDRIVSHRERGGTILIATHRPDELGVAIDRHLRITAGRLAAV